MNENNNSSNPNLPWPPPHRAQSRGERLAAAIEWLSYIFAIAGGILLIAIMVLTVVSVIGRYVFNTPIPGDYELTELACAIVVFAFFPYCHVTSANIVVDFFTNRLTIRQKAILDSLHGLAFTIMAALITWRLFVGGIRKLDDSETTLFLGIPIHFAYFSAFLAAVLLTAVCVLVVKRHFNVLRS